MSRKHGYHQAGGGIVQLKIKHLSLLLIIGLIVSLLSFRTVHSQDDVNCHITEENALMEPSLEAQANTDHSRYKSLYWITCDQAPESTCVAIDDPTLDFSVEIIGLYSLLDCAEEASCDHYVLTDVHFGEVCVLAQDDGSLPTCTDGCAIVRERSRSPLAGLALVIFCCVSLTGVGALAGFIWILMRRRNAPSTEPAEAI